MTALANWQEVYSDRLHASAARWGYDPPQDRPLINDNTLNQHYPTQDLTIVEVLTFERERARARVEIFTLNGLWSYCLRVSLKGRGMGFGPFLKFCEPYPTQTDATLAAGHKIVTFLRKDKPRTPDDTKMLRWARTLGQPRQLSLL